MLNATYIIIALTTFIPALVLHEVFHGLAAARLGDPTAKNAGRLSLNPLKHIDPFGTVILPGLLMMMGAPVFGYAKPVPYDPTYFKNPRVGDAIVGFAGPFANLLMALAGALVARFMDPSAVIAAGSFATIFVYQWLPTFVLVNLVFMVFNLLPIPPLDGSSIFALVIPEKHLGAYYRVQGYALPVLMIALFVVPQIFHVNPIGVFIDATAGSLFNLIYPA